MDAAGRSTPPRRTASGSTTPRRAVAEIALPGAVNFAFGGDALFITADDAIWVASLDTRS